MKPVLEIRDGAKQWTLNGKLHREDGPAYQSIHGGESWWVNGKLHRIDGPAIPAVGNNLKNFYYLDGKEYFFEEWDRLRKMIWVL